jgi:uncharacterized OsmC-like protein
MKKTLTFQAKNEGFGFTIDLPYGELHISSDDQFGFRPYQLLVSSVAACSGSTLRKILNKQRIQIDDMRVVADVTKNDEGAQEIEKIHMHFDIFGPELDVKKIEKALELTRKYCSMVQSVNKNIDITESYALHPSAAE